MRFWDYLIEVQRQKTIRKALENRARAMEACWGHDEAVSAFKDVAKGLDKDLETVKDLYYTKITE